MPEPRIFEAGKFYFPKGVRFMVDTNVWMHEFIPEVTADLPDYKGPSPLKKGAEYSRVLEKSKEKGALAVLCSSVWAEFVGLYEWAAAAAQIAAITERGHLVKEYRSRHGEARAKRMGRLPGLLEQILTAADLIPMPEGPQLAPRVNELVRLYPLDAHDAAIVATMEASSIEWLLTDDGDYSQVPNIKVVTANRVAISKAKDAGLLGEADQDFGGAVKFDNVLAGIFAQSNAARGRSR